MNLSAIPAFEINEAQFVPVETESGEKRQIKLRLRLQLGKKLLADARLADAKFKLAEFEINLEEEKFAVEQIGRGANETRIISRADLKRERRAMALAEAADDGKTGFLRRNAEDLKISIEKAADYTVKRANKRIAAEQEPQLSQINTKIAEKTQSLKEIVGQAAARQKQTADKTLTLFNQSGKTSAELTPILKPEIVWDEQIRALRRSDVASFLKLEAVHRAANVPRANEAYARLRSAQVLSDLVVRRENQRLLQKAAAQNSRQPRLVIELSFAAGKLEVVNWRRSAAGDEQQSPDTKGAAQDQAGSAPESNNRAALHTFLNEKIIAQNTKPAPPPEITPRLTQPIKAIRFDPARIIVQQVSDYFAEPERSQMLNIMVQDALTQTLKQPPELQPEQGLTSKSQNNPAATAAATRRAIADEETLRHDLRENAPEKVDLLKTPGNRYTLGELKLMGEISSEIGDAKVLATYHQISSRHPQLAAECDEASVERRAAKWLLAEMRTTKAADDAIESVCLTERGTLEIEVNPALLMIARSHLETGAAAETWQAKITRDNEASRPRLNLQEIEEAEQLMNRFALPDTSLMKYFEAERVRAGDAAMRAAVQPLTAAEQVMLQQMTIPDDTLKRFAEITEFNRDADRRYDEAQADARNNAAFRDTAQNFIMSNPAEEREAESRRFWQQDRERREAGMSYRERQLSVISDEQHAELTADAEADEMESELDSEMLNQGQSQS